MRNFTAISLLKKDLHHSSNSTMYTLTTLIRDRFTNSQLNNGKRLLVIADIGWELIPGWKQRLSWSSVKLGNRAGDHKPYEELLQKANASRPEAQRANKATPPYAQDAVSGSAATPSRASALLHWCVRPTSAQTPPGFFLPAVHRQ